MAVSKPGTPKQPRRLGKIHAAHCVAKQMKPVPESAGHSCHEQRGLLPPKESQSHAENWARLASLHSSCGNEIQGKVVHAVSGPCRTPAILPAVFRVTVPSQPVKRCLGRRAGQSPGFFSRSFALKSEKEVRNRRSPPMPGTSLPLTAELEQILTRAREILKQAGVGDAERGSAALGPQGGDDRNDHSPRRR